MEPWVQQLLQLGLAWAAIGVIGAMVVVAVFLACRYVLLWFFRVNEAVAQLRDAAESLRAIHALLREQRVAPPAQVSGRALAHGSTPARAPAGEGSAAAAAPVMAAATA